MYSAVILAAGEADRMGKLKQLLPWKEKTILETVIDNVLDSKHIDDEIRIVLGAQADRVKDKISYNSDKRIIIKENPDYKEGMSTSLKKGIEHLSESTKYLVIFLGDQPLITPDIFDNIINRFEEISAEIMLPVYNKKPGHPVIISTEYLPEINKLEGPMGLKPFLDSHKDIVKHYPVENNKVIIDLDYYDDYLYYKDKYS
ncbi:MAG: nucleotidyltransferase family protein [Halanaerobiales bacterium]|nr:nucleotidyltransferase family protein [Halanaerobiales bacterium]